MYDCVTNLDQILKISASEIVIMRRKVLYLIVFEVFTRYTFYFSLLDGKMNLAVRRSVGVPDFLVAMIVRHPSISEFCGIWFRFTTLKRFSNLPYIPCLTDSWLLGEKYLRTDYKSTSVRNMSTYHVVVANVISSELIPFRACFQSC